MLRFVKPAVIVKATPLEKCEYKVEVNQRFNDELIIGQEVRDFIKAREFSANQLTGGNWQK